MSRREFGTELSARFRQTLDEAAVGEATRLLLYQSEGPARLWTQVAALPSWRERGRYLFEMAFPPPDYMRRRFRSAGPLAYARRLGGGLRRLLGPSRP
ncbi:MAG: hypothetical protein AAGE01_18435 [Pseudomonadota bacterium]